MANWNLGSAATQLHSLVESIPTAISGAILLDIVDRNRIFIEQYTGQTVGSVGIDIKWQGALIDLSASELLSLMNTIGADTNSISLGDFSESKGGESNLMVASKNFEERGMKKLATIGTKIRLYKAFG